MILKPSITKIKQKIINTKCEAFMLNNTLRLTTTGNARTGNKRTATFINVSHRWDGRMRRVVIIYLI